ncbi:MAG TPA: hypothetical protein VFE62_25370 [Gemmataceae bacterium]|nr:hypothetical protein [Gemmataceae bacterium]
MRKILVTASAFALVIAAYAAAQPGPGKKEEPTTPKAKTINIDGDWTALYVEMEGKPADLKGFTDIKIKKNVITCMHNGKLRTFRMQFGPHHMVRCTEENMPITQPTENRTSHTHHGVYVASRNYLSFSMTKGAETARSEARGAVSGWTKEGPVGADMVIVLRRSGADIAGQ